MNLFASILRVRTALSYHIHCVYLVCTMTSRGVLDWVCDIINVFAMAPVPLENTDEANKVKLNEHSVHYRSAFICSQLGG